MPNLTFDDYRFGVFVDMPNLTLDDYKFGIFVDMPNLTFDDYKFGIFSNFWHHPAVPLWVAALAVPHAWDWRHLHEKILVI